MSTIKSSSEHLTLNADGSGKEVKIQRNGTQVLATSSSGIDVSGNVTSESSGGTDNYYFTGKKSGTTRYSVYENSDDVYINTWGGIALRANQHGGSGGVIALTGGNVGIGTSAPLGKLTIESNASHNNQFLNFNNTETNNVRNWSMGIADGSSGTFRVYDLTAGLERLRIDSGGCVTMPYQPRASLSHTALVSLTSVVLTSSNFYNHAWCNVGNHFSGTTGRFTCPVAGIYRIYFRYTSNISGSNIRLRKNGSSINEAYNSALSSLDLSSVSSEVVIPCIKDDYLDIQAETFGALAGEQHKQVTFELLG